MAVMISDAECLRWYELKTFSKTTTDLLHKMHCQIKFKKINTIP